MLKPARNDRARLSPRAPISFIDPDFDIPNCAPVDGKVTLTGVSNGGVRVDVYVDGVKVATVNAVDNPTGSWSIPVPITPGLHSIRVEDEAGDSVTKNADIPAIGCNTFNGGVTIGVQIGGVTVTVGGLMVTPGPHTVTIRVEDEAGNSVTRYADIPVGCSTAGKGQNGEYVEAPVGIAAAITSRPAPAKTSPRKSGRGARPGKN